MYYNREKRKFCVTSSSSSSGLEEDIHMGAEGEGLMTLGTLNDARHSQGLPKAHVKAKGS